MATHSSRAKFARIGHAHLAEQNRKVLDESRVLDILRQTPASRFGNADELIGATLLLASSKAGSFITGVEMIVDGGFNAMTI